jgi:outer membrane autotransporter protein
LAGRVVSSGNVDLSEGQTILGSEGNTAGLSAPNLTVGDGGTSNLTVDTGGILTISNKLTVANAGSIIVLPIGGSIDVGLVSDSAPAGSIAIGFGGSLKNFGDVYASSIILGLGATAGGSGNYHGTVVNGGKIAPGDPQTMTIIGNYTQLPTGTLDLQIAGTNPADADHLVVTGQATLGGFLELDFVNGFAPQAGNVFNLLTFGSTTGQFAGVEVTGLAPGWTFTLSPANGVFNLLSTSNGVSSPEFVVSPGPIVLLAGIPPNENVHFTGGILEAATSSTLTNPVILDLAGGTFQADAGTASTLSGAIIGPGSFTKTGPGLLTLSGNNTYQGGTAINGGVLAVFSDANLGAAGTGVSFGGGTLQALASFTSPRPITLNTGGGTIDTNGFNLTLSGILSGAGGLTKISAGTLTLTGNNLYTGGTAINGGVLAVSSDANLGDPSGPLSFGGGTLQTLASFASSRGIVLNAGGGTIDSNAFNLTLNGAISGSGGLTKIGAGTLFLESQNSYTGLTLVTNGRLYIDGSVGGDVDVFAPGFLGGHGVIGGGLFNAGTVSPGNSPGTLTVRGNYVQSSAGTLTIEVGGPAASQHDLLAVNGQAILAGTLQLVRLNNFNLQRGEVIPFLTANGGISGGFATVTNPFTTGTFLNTEVVYGPNSVSLEMEQASFAQFAKDARLNANEQAVASALDRVAFDPREKNLIAYLDGESLNQLPKRFEQISPDQLTSIYQTTFSLATLQNTNLQRRAEDLRLGANGFSAAGFAMNGGGPSYSGSLDPGSAAGAAGPTGEDGKDEKTILAPAPDNRWGAFLTGTGEFVNVDGTENARGYEITTSGFTLGLDYKVTPNFALGISAGYTGTSADLADGGRVLVNGGKGGLYGTYFAEGFYLDGVVNGGYNSYDTHREALRGTARGDTDGGEFNALLGTGYDWKSGAFTFGPIASLQYTYLGVGTFAETGSDAPLQIERGHDDSIQTRLGFKANYQWKVGSVVVRPEIRASWLHEYGDDQYAIGSRFASGAGDVFVVNGSRIGRDGLLVGAGFSVQFDERVSAYLFYDGELGRTNYETNSVSGGFSVAF